MNARWRHYSKGSCCGKACRHCVWDHEKVPEERKAERIYNSAFWIDKPDLIKDEWEEPLVQLFAHVVDKCEQIIKSDLKFDVWRCQNDEEIKNRICFFRPAWSILFLGRWSDKHLGQTNCITNSAKYIMWWQVLLFILVSVTLGIINVFYLHILWSR